MKPSPPPNQAGRLEALRLLGVIDSPREKDFDDIVELATHICDVPIGVITLVEQDRQWFKAKTGLEANETPVDQSICAHAILEPGITVIQDTHQDPRTSDNPLCNGEDALRFYAGAPLRGPDGHVFGTLCVLDYKPRTLDATQRMTLDVLARQVVAQMLLRKMAVDEKNARALADEKVLELEEAARTQEILTKEVDHRVKNSLQQVAALLNLQTNAAPEAVAPFLADARDRVLAIAALHDQLNVTANQDRVDMQAFLERLAESLKGNLPDNVSIKLDASGCEVDTRKASTIGIIVNELVANAIKHAFPDGRRGEIRMFCESASETLNLEISDTGIGSPAESGRQADASAKPGGLGMRIIRSSVKQLDGTIQQQDNGPGTKYSIAIPLGKTGC